MFNIIVFHLQKLAFLLVCLKDNLDNNSLSNNSHHLSYHLDADDIQIVISLYIPGANCSLQQLREKLS